MANALIHEKSPYLQQHAHNPVNWNPWTPESLSTAQRENKLIFVSIGYATCHWCHVMETESFEDQETADLLNQHFISIKIDREERPDLDRVFMASLHALGRQGGWPLNCFCTPKGEPFFGGTYFPKTQRYGISSFKDILNALAKSWQETPREMETQAEKIVDFITQTPDQAAPPVAVKEIWGRGYLDLQGSFDAHHGGFLSSSSNKFPASMSLEFLLAYQAKNPGAAGSNMVCVTLDQMIQGGISDQIGGGLCRYSTDPQWLIPHFEKMLYDNALFIRVLALSYCAFQSEEHKTAALGCCDYLLRDLMHPDGAFYSAEDADSEGAEGQFYIWGKDEVSSLIPNAQEFKIVCLYWGLTEQGNFEGKNNLFQAQSVSQVATDLTLTVSEVTQSLERSGQTLFEHRAKRIRPLRDEKILCSWNSLAVDAFACAAVAFDRPDLGDSAIKAGQFIFDHFMDGKGRLFRRYKDGERKTAGFLCDYAQLGLAGIRLFELTWDLVWLKRAKQLADQLDPLFLREQGGYWEVGVDQEAHLSRGLDAYDGVEPSGNSAAARLFAQLAGYGFEEFHLKAQAIFQTFAKPLHGQPSSLSYMLCAMAEAQDCTTLVVIGDHQKDWLKKLRGHYLAGLRLVWVPEAQEEAFANALPIVGGKPSSKTPVAYWCEQQTCLAPIVTWGELEKKLGHSPFCETGSSGSRISMKAETEKTAWPKPGLP